MGKRRHSHTVDDDLFDAELDAESLEGTGNFFKVHVHS